MRYHMGKKYSNYRIRCYIYIFLSFFGGGLLGRCVGKVRKRKFSAVLLFSHSVMSNSFVTPWTVACQAPLSMGFPRKEHWNGLPFPSPGDLPDPEIEPEIEPVSPDLAGGFFTTEPLGKLSLLCGSLLLFKEENCSDLATSSQICQPFPRILESWITRNLCKTVSHSYSTPIYQ